MKKLITVMLALSLVLLVGCAKEADPVKPADPAKPADPVTPAAPK